MVKKRYTNVFLAISFHTLIAVFCTFQRVAQHGGRLQSNVVGLHNYGVHSLPSLRDKPNTNEKRLLLGFLNVDECDVDTNRQNPSLSQSHADRHYVDAFLANIAATLSLPLERSPPQTLAETRESNPIISDAQALPPHKNAIPS